MAKQRDTKLSFVWFKQCTFPSSLIKGTFATRKFSFKKEKSTWKKYDKKRLYQFHHAHSFVEINILRTRIHSIYVHYILSAYEIKFYCRKLQKVHREKGWISPRAREKSGVCLLIYYLFCNLSTYYLNNQIYLKHFILLRAVSFDGVYQFSSDVHCIAPCWVCTLRSLIALNSRIVWRVLLHIFATPFFPRYTSFLM